MKIYGLRWWVIALIAFATIINYIDRQSLNVLWPEISVNLFPEKTDFERKEIFALISMLFSWFHMLLVRLFSGKFLIGLEQG